MACSLMRDLIRKIRYQGLVLSTMKSIATGVVGQLLLLISGPLAARILGVEGRGSFAAISVWGIMLTSIGTMGIPAACAYFINKEPENIRKILGETYRMVFIQIVIVLPVLCCVLLWWSQGKTEEIKTAVYISLLIVPVSILHESALAILQGQHRFAAMNWMRTMPAFLYAFAVAILFFIKDVGLPSIMIAWVLSYALSALFSTIAALKCNEIAWQPDRKLRGRLIKFGLYGHVGTLSPVDSLRVDQVIGSIFLSSSSLGLYAVASAFTNVPRFLAHSAGLIAYPAIAKNAQSKTARRMVFQYFFAISLLNIGVSILLIFMMPLVIPWLFGIEFIGSVSLAQILIVGTTLAASRRILVECLRGLGYPSVSTFAELSMYPWLVLGGWFLMYRDGVVGLALSVTVGYGVSLLTAIIAWAVLEKKHRAMKGCALDANSL